MEARRRQYMQPLRVPHAPTRLEHNRLLPPLADQPYLELRRPSFKDACFTTSALSPCWVGKRYGGEWDAASTRTSLLDRYLSQDEQPTPYSHDLAPSPIPQTPILNDISNALPHPSNSKKFWVYRAAQKAALENPNKSITMRSDCVATPPLIIPPPSVSYFSPDTATEPEELVSAVETPINDDTQSEPATPLSRTPMEMLTERAMISGGLDSRFPPLPSRYHFPPSSRIQETDFDTSSVRSLPISTREQHDPIDGRIKLIRSQTLDAVPPQRAQRVQKRRPPPLKIISAISDIDSPPSTAGLKTAKPMKGVKLTSPPPLPQKPLLRPSNIIIPKAGPSDPQIARTISGLRSPPYCSTNKLIPTPPSFSPQTPTAMDSICPIILRTPYQQSDFPDQEDEDGPRRGRLLTKSPFSATPISPRARSHSAPRSAYPNDDSFPMRSFALADSPFLYPVETPLRSRSANRHEKGYVPSDCVLNGKHAIMQSYFQKYSR